METLHGLTPLPSIVFPIGYKASQRSNLGIFASCNLVSQSQHAVHLGAITSWLQGVLGNAGRNGSGAIEDGPNLRDVFCCFGQCG